MWRVVFMNKNVWLFPQNSCSLNQFFITLNVFAKLNGISRKENVTQVLMREHSKLGAYNPYIQKDYYDLSSANHKIDEPRFYGAIYETPNKKIHVSSYGELLLKYERDEIKRNKVFIGMIYNIQFCNPYKKMKDLNIYPLRLIFNLLCDRRLGYKLTNIEVSAILYYVKTIEDEVAYNKIVDKILTVREYSSDEMFQYLTNQASQFVKNYVSCNYLFNILSDLEIINQTKSVTKFKIQSPARRFPTTITGRTITLNSLYMDFIKRYNQEKSMYDKIIQPTGLRSDWIREIYNSIPSFLLEEIQENDTMYTKYLQIPKLLIETSTNPTKWSEFEECITQSFNLFSDVEAETIGGPGQPDSLCHFLGDHSLFCADGKSTGKKLSSINDGRLKQHRNQYNAKYTIVVTPGYVPSAVEDIIGTRTCIITSYCFADLITKYIFKLYKNKEDCSYEIFNNLVLENLGTDLSEKIYKIIDDRLGISVDSL